MQPEVLILDRIGGAYTHASLLAGGLGGSEIEVLQVAHGLTAQGHRVVIANGVERVTVEDGVTYVPHAHAWQHAPTKALYLQRWSIPETRLELAPTVRVIVRANDVYCAPYDVHKELLASGRGALVANTQWQAAQFGFAREKTIIPPMLEPMPKVKKQKGLFVFASGAMKGFEATVALWCEMKSRHSAMHDAELLIVPPGWGHPRSLTAEETAANIRCIGQATTEKYRYWIARAEGLFMVLTMPETFCCAAALAERAGTRTHVLCQAGLSGLWEAAQNREHITEDPAAFEASFVGALTRPLGTPPKTLPDLTPTHLIDRWADVLAVTGPPKVHGFLFPDDPTLEQNQTPLGPFFGDFLSQLRGAITPGGSEFGVGLMLFSLAASIQAKRIVEIGRFKGFSTLALAAACQLQQDGWTDPKASEQRPDVDYRKIAVPPRLLSIDPAPSPDAASLLDQAAVMPFVTFCNQRSDTVTPTEPIDLLFIDGGHTLADVQGDVQRFVPWVRPGGYFVLHDYFGWFTNGRNGSAVAKVIVEDLQGCDRVLIDTTHASLVIFRKATNLTERWELDPKPSKLPARADGRPTVGLCLIAKGEEVSTVLARAILSGKKAGVDCVTVVCDAEDAAADVARSMGADVFLRATPAHDWDTGIGWIAGARNDALAIAERRTDYVLVLDADDYFEGTLPDVFDKDAYEVTITDGSLVYSRVALFRSSLHWRYQGIIHETLQTGPTGPMGRLTGLTYRRGRSAYAAQDQVPPEVKYAKHAHLATKWLLDRPDDARMQFYLARSYQDSGQTEKAVTAYERRIEMLNGWDEERSYSAYQIGLIRMAQGQDPTSMLLQAAGIGVPKAEPFVALARWYRDDARRQFSTAYLFAERAAEIPQPTAALFTHPWIYQFEAAAEVAIASYWLGHTQDALARFEALLPKVPPERRPWAEEQIAICVRELARR